VLGISPPNERRISRAKNGLPPDVRRSRVSVGPRKREAETFADEVVQGAERERRDLESRDLFFGTKLLETERRFRSLAMRREQSDGLVRQAP